MPQRDISSQKRRMTTMAEGGLSHLQRVKIVPRRPYSILVTNDDGVTSPGIIALADAASAVGKVAVIAPEGEQSAAAMSLTFHKPLRVKLVKAGRRQAYGISGTPADSTSIGVHKFLSKRPDAVVSGINIGENLTIQDILASGTVAAAFEAALMGIPGLAFSMEIPERKAYVGGVPYSKFALPAKIAAAMLRDVLEEGLPSGADILNVNFPWNISAKTDVKITSPEARKYKDYVTQREDPRGRPYYWVWGSRLSDFRKDSDAYAVLNEHSISVSPLSLDLSPRKTKDMRDFESRLNSRAKQVIRKFHYHA